MATLIARHRGVPVSAQAASRLHRRPNTSSADDPRRRRRFALLALIWVVASVFYLWTATSAGDQIHLDTPQSDYYNQLADGFLDGELSIPTVPPPALVHLADPYNPVQSAPFQAEFHDLSLYHGHLYLSWGPTPVLVLFIPWRVLGIGSIPQNLAAVLFAVVGLAVMLALLELLVRRYLRRAPPWKVGLGALALSSSSVVPFLLRRVSVYEVAISCVYCCVAGGLFLLAAGLYASRRQRTLLVLGSLGLGFAVGARFELAVTGILIVAVAVAVDRRSPSAGPARRLRAVAPVVVPFAVATLLVLAYNFARFHNPLQIGSAYQLAGFDPATTPYDQLSYVAPSLYYYVLAPLRLTLAFPFLALPPPVFYPLSVPSAYRPEVVGGLLATAPVLLLLFGAASAFRRAVAADPTKITTPTLFAAQTELKRIVGALVLTACVVALLVSFAVPGATERYEVDFASLAMIASILVWLSWRPVHRVSRWVLDLMASVLIVVGAVVGVALSVTGPTDQMNLANQAGYQKLEDDFAFIPTLVTKIEGRARVVRIIDPRAGYPIALGDYGTFAPGTLRFTLLQTPEEIDLVAPDTGRYLLTTRVERTASAPRQGSVELHFAVGSTRINEPLVYGRPLDLTVHLAEGLNRLSGWATFIGVQPKGAYLDIVNVYGLRVTRKG